jgi:alpha-beta hydrolase superfamily lysophospholipase
MPTNNVEVSHLGPLKVWRHKTVHSPLSRVIIVHGMGEHSARHLNTVQFLLEKGFEVIRFDLRGSGESGGPRQYIERFDDYVEDLTKVYHWAHLLEPKLETVILGHSMGGAISLRFAARYSAEIKALALTSPAYKVGSGVSKLKIAVGKLLVPAVPWLRIPKSTPADAISRDPAVVEAYRNDALACSFNTLRQGSELLKALDETMLFPEHIRCPVAIFHGSHDKIVECSGSFDLIRAFVNAPIKDLFVLPQGYHEPHNDLDKDYFFALLAEWMKKCLKNR